MSPQPLHPRLPLGVAEHLGFYVYLYIDPRTGRPFYVGKGQRNRVLAHLAAHSNRARSLKVRILRELRARRLRPRIEILAHALPSEEVAFRIEAAVIDLLGLDDLANLTSGWRSIQLGRMPLEDAIAYYAARPAKVVHRVLLIRINRNYRHGMPDAQLYHFTRGTWKLGKRREGARYALAVFHGLVREVYDIRSWHEAATTRDRSGIVRKRDRKQRDRCEFKGRVAPETVRKRYVGRSVAQYFKQGSQSPVVYVGC